MEFLVGLPLTIVLAYVGYLHAVLCYVWVDEDMVYISRWYCVVVVHRKCVRSVRILQLCNLRWVTLQIELLDGSMWSPSFVPHLEITPVNVRVMSVWDETLESYESAKGKHGQKVN
jgi:hypothetical protein